MPAAADRHPGANVSKRAPVVCPTLAVPWRRKQKRVVSRAPDAQRTEPGAVPPCERGLPGCEDFAGWRSGHQDRATCRLSCASEPTERAASCRCRKGGEPTLREELRRGG